MPAEKLELIPENTSLWNERMLWSKDISLRSGAGYKDNVFLTPAPRGSGFVINGIDVGVNRLPLDGLQCIFFLTGDDTRYWGNVPPPVTGHSAAVRTVDHEDLLLGSAQLQRYFGSNWRVGAEFRESYVDQVQYILTQNGLTNALVDGHMLDGRLFVRWNLGEQTRLQLDGLVTRSLFGPLPLDNSWKFGPRIIVGHEYGNSSDIAITYTALYQAHDTLDATDAGDMPVPGKKLATWQHHVELTSQHYWDGKKHWRSNTTLSFYFNQDNGAGFYDYYRYSLGEELRYHSPRWEVKAIGRISWDDWPVARANGDLSGPKLNREVWSLGLRTERQIYKTFRLYAEYSHEETISNSALDEYQANTVTGGVSFEF